MTSHTLLTGIYAAHHLKQFEKILKLPFEDLNVDVRILGAKANRWVQVDVSGEDEPIVTNYLAREFVFCPETIYKVQKNTNMKGYITEFGNNLEQVCVDVGVFQPSSTNATIPIRRLQTQLVEGRKATLKKINALFAFCEDMPINVKIMNVDQAESHIEAELSPKQIERYNSWQNSLLDRLIVLGSSYSELRKILRKTDLNRDIIAIEPMGTFEHALTCKLGTDAAGLIAKIGRKLGNSKFSVFNPREIRQFLRNLNS